MAGEAWPNNLAGLYRFCCLDMHLSDQPTELRVPLLRKGKNHIGFKFTLFLYTLSSAKFHLSLYNVALNCKDFQKLQVRNRKLAV